MCYSLKNAVFAYTTLMVVSVPGGEEEKHMLYVVSSTLSLLGEVASWFGRPFQLVAKLILFSWMGH